MISDKQTNVVYLAEGLKHYMPAYKSLLDALYSRRVHMNSLPLTASKKHIWARDYMPIQLDKGQFLLYTYHPDYLHGFEDFIPDYRAICKDLGLECVSTDIVLDGGNVVKCGDKVIMTDKIIEENPMRFYKDILRELENHFQAQIVLIPRDRYDRYGHADGMVRWIDGNRVLLNNYTDFDPSWERRSKPPCLSISPLRNYATAQTSISNTRSTGHTSTSCRLKEKSLFLDWESKKIRWLSSKSRSSILTTTSALSRTASASSKTAEPSIASHGTSLPIHPNGPKMKHNPINYQ